MIDGISDFLISLVSSLERLRFRFDNHLLKVESKRLGTSFV